MFLVMSSRALHLPWISAQYFARNHFLHLDVVRGAPNRIAYQSKCGCIDPRRNAEAAESSTDAAAENQQGNDISKKTSRPPCVRQHQFDMSSNVCIAQRDRIVELSCLRRLLQFPAAQKQCHISATPFFRNHSFDDHGALAAICAKRIGVHQCHSISVSEAIPLPLHHPQKSTALLL